MTTLVATVLTAVARGLLDATEAEVAHLLAELADLVEHWQRAHADGDETMMRLAREREKLRVVQDQFGCPTWSRMIAETTALALKQKLAAAEPHAFQGIYHLAASGHTSWHGFAEAIVGLMPESERKCRVVEPIPTT